MVKAEHFPAKSMRPSPLEAGLVEFVGKAQAFLAFGQDCPSYASRISFCFFTQETEDRQNLSTKIEDKSGGKQACLPSPPLVSLKINDMLTFRQWAVEIAKSHPIPLPEVLVSCYNSAIMKAQSPEKRNHDTALS